MIRNYNGNLNYTIVREIKKMCKANAKKLKEMTEEYEQKGKVSFYAKLCPFTGYPDEKSEFVTLKSKTEIREYLKKDFQQGLEEYLNIRKPSKDYLLNGLIEFIKENAGNFPNKDEMKLLEQKAEVKRITELPSVAETKSISNTKQEVIKEILELAEEIMEVIRENKPEDISVYLVPYQDELIFKNDNFYVLIQWNRYFGKGDSRDYSCTIAIKDGYIFNVISFYYQYDGTPSFQIEGWCNNIGTKTIKSILNVHKIIVQIAEQEGIEFTSEIDYEKFSV